MTEMQVKAQANRLKEEELAQKAQELRLEKQKIEEAERSNRAKEALTEAADRAKYGYSTYMGPEWSGQDISKNPQTLWNNAKEVFETIMNPFSIFQKLFK